MSDLLNKKELSRAVLVKVVPKGADEHEYSVSLAELENLAKTAGAEVIATMVQQKENPDPATYIGSGKLKELSMLCIENKIDTVIFDCELQPSKIKNIEDGIGRDVMVMDRSMLILDVFALHAVSSDGKLQVELAQLKYTVPRLIGKGTQLSRLGGGIGTRGPGESKLETDKRHVQRRIESLEAELAEMNKNRAVQRASRDRSGVFKFAIAGYTNAGKSTLMNYLTQADVLVEDKLFATLDPTTRKYNLPSGTSVLLTDTVGFIRNLPHHLIKAFKSTLDEVAYSDGIIIVIDYSDENAKSQLEVTQNLITELEAGGKPVIYVFNKCDAVKSSLPGEIPDDTVFISARTGQGTEDLINKLEKIVGESKRTLKFSFPLAQSGYVSQLYKMAIVQDVVYKNDSVEVVAICDNKIAGQLKDYIVKDDE
ncbi:MAG: GTPase HflX [Clostridia bacterium]|nr:GTPase HflX [Clostridia bacterium]